LAIELAAARLRVLGVEALRSRLHDRLAVLTGGARDLPGRQQTLRGAIAWSHELLDEPDRRLFARFSVISGGAALPQVEGACGPSSELGRDVFDCLDSLATQSLLRPVEAMDDELRFGMLATIREFALERLQEDAEAHIVHRRHAVAYLELAEEAAPHLIGAGSASWNDRLEVEHDNLRAALDWIVASDLAELGLRLVTALWRFWYPEAISSRRANASIAWPLPSAGSRHRPCSQGRTRRPVGRLLALGLEPAHETMRRLCASPACRVSPLLAEALYNAGFAPDPQLVPAGALPRGQPYFEESLAMYRSLGDRVTSALWRPISAAATKDRPRTRELVSESLALVCELGDPFRIDKQRTCSVSRTS
jgi:hypothetical protein